MDRKTVGSRIRQRRIELDLNQDQLAELVVSSSNHLSGIENGKRTPSLPLFVKLCEKLKTTPDYILLENAHSDNVPQSIYEKLLLCNEADLKLACDFIELLVQRNQDAYADHTDGIWKK